MLCEDDNLVLALLTGMLLQHQVEGFMEWLVTGVKVNQRVVWCRLRVDLRSSLDQVAAAQGQQQCLVQQLQVRIRAVQRPVGGKPCKHRA